MLVERKRRVLEESIINKNYFNYEGRLLGERNLERRWRKHSGTNMVEENCGIKM